MTDEDFRGLAGVRKALRQFLGFSEATLGSVGVTPQQYQALLAIRAHALRQPSIKELATELLLRPNGAVQLVDRLAALGLVERLPAANDRRSVLVGLTADGGVVIERLAAEHLAELLRHRPLLVDSLRRLKSMGKP